MDKNFILVVDDNHINRLFFESSFKKHGYQVCLAENGYQALDLCQDNTFAIILMDIRMDGMDGIQTATAIKKIPAQQRTPIIAVSAERFEWDKCPAFTNSLLKPISQDDIKHIITTYVSNNHVFDHECALEISHNDEEIVTKLRHMLVDQLPNDWQTIKRLHQDKNFRELDTTLHKVAGSARVCAANLLSKQLDLYKQHLSNDDLREQYFHELEAAIQTTIKSGVSNS